MTQRTVLDWLRVEYAIEKPSQKLQALTGLDSDAFIAEVKKLRGKKQPLTAASLAALRAEYTNRIEPARAIAAETLQLECTLSDLIHHGNLLKLARQFPHESNPPPIGRRLPDRRLFDLKS